MKSSSKSLFKPIYCFIQFSHQVRRANVFQNLCFIHVNFFFKILLKKALLISSCFKVQLDEKAKIRITHSLRLKNLRIINVIFLFVTFYHHTGLVFIQSAITLQFDLIKLFRRNRLAIFGFRNQSPWVVPH